MSERRKINIDDIVIDEYELETTEITQTYRVELRTQPPDVLEDYSDTDWKSLRWPDVGTPFALTEYSTKRLAWEAKHEEEMPEAMQWQLYNRDYFDIFSSDESEQKDQLKKQLRKSLLRLKITDADDTLQEMIRLKAWHNIHRSQDALWDPRGKREVFRDLEVDKPNILVLGAGDGYDAMVLLSMYQGGSAILVDYDHFCKTHRFGRFPDNYPFLSQDKQSGYWNIYHKDDLNIEYLTCDFRNLPFGREFDIVISPGLIDHYPDKYKALIFHYHRQFLRPGGYAIFTCAKDTKRLRFFYQVMKEILNFSYRELMQPKQLGLYAYLNGFRILRCSSIKAHNCIIAQER